MALNKKSLWIGIGIGATAGLAGGFVIGNQVTKRAARKDIKRIRHQAYLKGVEDTKAEYEANVVFVDSTDPEVINKAVQAHLQAQKENETAEEESGEQDIPEDKPEPQERPPEAKKEDETFPDDSVYGVKETTRKAPGLKISGNYAIVEGAAGTEIYYPKRLFLDPMGELMDATIIRENVKEYETDIQKLRVIWNAMGWGIYIPDLDDNRNAWDENLDIDDTELGDEPMEKTMERQRYLDEVERYIDHPEEAPRLISRQEFEEECYLDQLYFDYYDVDNKFVENTDMNREVDAVTLFGVADGNELFKRKAANKDPNDDEDDPDIVYVKNFAQNCVMEVTRFHKSYSSVVDGSAYVNGGTV